MIIFQGAETFSSGTFKERLPISITTHLRKNSEPTSKDTLFLISNTFSGAIEFSSSTLFAIGVVFSEKNDNIQFGCTWEDFFKSFPSKKSEDTDILFSSQHYLDFKFAFKQFVFRKISGASIE